ncbi:MAG: hypothetical protein J6C40_03985 [Lentisphaeria bacterium]|nr:hypothetical protein [Lentisphaeria bacterium]
MKKLSSGLFLPGILAVASVLSGCAGKDDRKRDERLVSLFRSSAGAANQYKAKEVIYDYNQVRRALLVRHDYMLSDEQIRENLKKLETELETAREFPHPPPEFTLPKCTVPPVLDGDFSEKAWEKALSFSGEYLLNCTEKKNDSAVWKIMYDENYFYFAARFPDTDFQKAPPETPYLADAFELFILPEKRYWTYVELVFSPWNDIYTKWVHQTPRSRMELSDYSPQTLLVRTKKNSGSWQLEGRIAFCELPAYLRGGVPRSSETLHAMMIRFDKNRTGEKKTFVPVPFLYDGHNIFGYMKLNLE